MPHLLRILPVVLLALLAGCAAVGSPGKRSAPESGSPYDKVTTFLMFEGDAEKAMEFYVSLFDDSEVLRVDRFGPNDAGPAGKILHAVFTLGGRPFIVFDSPAPHPFTFTPATSLFIVCDSEAEFDRLYEALAEDGELLMPAGDYGFSHRYAWVNDRFGVSWQINLAGIEFDRDAPRE